MRKQKYAKSCIARKLIDGSPTLFGHTGLLWEGLAWRRFTSHGGFAGGCTFHVGLSGMVADNWLKIARKNPHFVVFQGANWFKLSEERFGSVYSPPDHCARADLWRDESYCKPAKSSTW